MGDLYSNIKHQCDLRGITPARLCADLGMPKSTTTELKMGRARTLSYDKMKKMADYFGISVEQLAGDAAADADAEMAEILETLRSRPEMRTLFSVTKSATREDVEKAVAIIEALRDRG